MGSLMPGWSSKSPKQEKVRRHKSITKDEIDRSLGKSSRKTRGGGGAMGDEIESPYGSPMNGSPMSPSSFAASSKSSPYGSPMSPSFAKFTPFGSPKTPPVLGGAKPPVDGDDASTDKNGDASTEKNGDWWTRSKYAYLNEPPRDHVNDSEHKYKAQFEIAELAQQEII